MRIESVEAAINELQNYNEQQSNLCDDLEILADSLPSNVDKQFCLTIARQVFPLVCRAHRYEESTLFPMFEILAQQQGELHQSLNRLQFEHWEVESFAEDLSEALRQYCCSSDGVGEEKLSYMLRGFFEGLRRHIAFETEYLIPLLRQRSEIFETNLEILYPCARRTSQAL